LLGWGASNCGLLLLFKVSSQNRSLSSKSASCLGPHLLLLAGFAFGWANLAAQMLKCGGLLAVGERF